MAVGFFSRTDVKTFIDYEINFTEAVIPDWTQCVLKYGSSRHTHRYFPFSEFADLQHILQCIQYPSKISRKAM